MQRLLSLFRIVSPILSVLSFSRCRFRLNARGTGIYFEPCKMTRVELSCISICSPLYVTPGEWRVDRGVPSFLICHRKRSSRSWTNTVILLVGNEEYLEQKIFVNVKITLKLLSEASMNSFVLESGIFSKKYLWIAKNIIKYNVLMIINEILSL